LLQPDGSVDTLAGSDHILVPEAHHIDDTKCYFMLSIVDHHRSCPQRIIDAVRRSSLMKTGHPNGIKFSIAVEVVEAVPVFFTIARIVVRIVPSIDSRRRYISYC